jgi:cadmium resistance protein CadD (predicted permease)
MVAVVLAAILAFAATNIDDLFVLLVLFGQRRHAATVMLGQYLGFAAIIVVSVLVSVGAMLVRPEWIGFAGLAPLAIGIRGLVAVRGRGRDRVATPTISVTGALPIAAVTFANGGDNIAVYGPLLARRPFDEAALTIGVFGLLVGVWCAAAYWLVRLPIALSALERWGHRLAPFVLIGLSVYIFVGAGTAAVILGLVLRRGS